MVPWFRLRQHVKGFLGKHVVKFTEVVRDVTSRFVVTFERFCEPLRDGRGGPDVGGRVMKAGRKQTVILFEIWVIFVLVFEKSGETVPVLFRHGWKGTG
jgi:hypothetical protein